MFVLVFRVSVFEVMDSYTYFVLICILLVSSKMQSQNGLIVFFLLKKSFILELFGFYVISTFVGYLTLNPFLYK